MTPDRAQLKAMAEKDKELIKEYARRWCEVAAQVIPPMKEKEMKEIFLKTLGTFYYEKMVPSAPIDFTKMVRMAVRFEFVREGRFTRGEKFDSAKKPSYVFAKNKEGETNVVIQDRRVKPPRRNHHHQHHISSVTLVVNTTPTTVAYQRPAPQGIKGRIRGESLLTL